ncbi:hypothetical protein AB0O90_11165 [Microbacterium testaceum]|uniref:hypothetical protein n=1 Tax=Microbacterium testaceum TaxID=2033 RepID=UPI003430F7D1
MPSLSPRARRAPVILALAGVTLSILTACVPDATPSGDAARTTPPTVAAATPTPSVSATTDARLTAPASARVAPTCDNIMDPASGKTVREIVPVEGAVTLPTYPALAHGPRCTTSGSADGDYYTWSPASQTDWDALVAELTDDSAWFTEDGPRGTYLTYKIDGRYSQTFLFTGDAVILAPSKAATDFVIGPPLTSTR